MSANFVATPPNDHIANTLRTMRTNRGLTQAACASSCGVRTATWRNWELGTGTPKFWRGASIAQALGVPVAALFAPPGFVAVTDVQLTPEAAQRVRALGEPEAVRLSQQIAAQLPAMILATCRTSTPQHNPSGRGKPRRSRQQVLAGIAEANTMRQAASQRRANATGPSQAAGETSVGGLPGSLTAEG